MKVYSLDDMVRGWFVGDFSPAIVTTPFFELGVLTRKKGENCHNHIHISSTEVNVLLDGKMTLNGTDLKQNDVFILDKNEESDATFHEDCRILVLRVPSITNDKVITNGSVH